MKRLSLTVHVVALALAVGSLACGDDRPKVMVDEPDLDGGVQGGSGGGTGAGGGAGSPDAAIIIIDAAIPEPECSVAFATPTAGQTLKSVVDTGTDGCGGGFETDVTAVVAGGVSGATVALSSGGNILAQTTLSGTVATFSSVTLGAGALPLTVTVAGTPTCTATIDVTVACDARPSCAITAPAFSSTKPALNNVPVADGGDRVSSDGSDYQAAVEVTTDLADGETVSLEVTPESSSTTQVLTAMVAAGKATFPGVTLRPDGLFTAQATCTNADDVSGSSSQIMIPVDTEAPDLTVSSPVDGAYFGPDDLDSNDMFEVCVSTTAADSYDLGNAADNMGENICVGIGTASPECAAVTKGSNATAAGCVKLVCPGGAPFNLNLTLKDAAGNPTSAMVQGVSCASELPSVQIVTPLGDVAPYADQSKRLLAADSAQAFKDADGSTPGAQTEVVACTDRPGVSQLWVGLEGGTSNAIGSPVDVVASTPSDGCPTGFGYVARWSAATLAESDASSTALMGATEITVQHTGLSSAVGISPVVRLWVDAVAPTLSTFDPNPFCGLIQEQATAWTPSEISFVVSSASLVRMTVENGGSSAAFEADIGPALATFDDAVFEVGLNEVSLVAEDIAGNITSGLPAGCTVAVGLIPIVEWQKPDFTSLCALETSGSCTSDSDSGQPGWQGDLEVKVTVNGVTASSGTVTFALGSTDLGTVNIGVDGIAELTGVTIPDGGAAQLVAVTSDISGTGIGSADYNVLVDTLVPDAVTNLNVIVADRRASSFSMTWDAPADNGASVSGYLIRVAEEPLSGVNFDNLAVADAVSYSGSPVSPGSSESIVIGGRRIETEQYFGVVPVDEAGNRGALQVFGPVRAEFLRHIIPRPSSTPTGSRFGRSVDGFADLTGDGISDLVVGTGAGRRAYIIEGSSTPTGIATPLTEIVGPASVGFGLMVKVIGDINDDGKPDIAVAARSANRVYIFEGRDNWPALLDADTQADHILELGPSSFFGVSMARLGDFSGDGIDDFAVGAFGASSNVGRVDIILGKDGFNVIDPEPDRIIINGEDLPPEVSMFEGFGLNMVGLGRFYTDAPGSTLVVAAGGIGKFYAFHGLGVGTVDAVTAARAWTDTIDVSYGTPMVLTGAVLGSLPGLAIGATLPLSGDSNNGLIDLYPGAGTDGLNGGPFAGMATRIRNDAASKGGDNFTNVPYATAFEGSSITASIIGDATPDFVLGARLENGALPKIYILDGAELSTAGSALNAPDAAAITLELPAGFTEAGGPIENGTVRDMTDDGYADFVVANGGSGMTENSLLLFY